MKVSQNQLPSDKKFGYFFGALFLILGIYFYYATLAALAFFLVAMSLCFILIAFVKADLLRGLNRAWMLFGSVLGMVISPLVLGVIFFGLFMPIGVVMRLFGRDELRLRFKNKSSHWIDKDALQRLPDQFKNQF